MGINFQGKPISLIPILCSIFIFFSTPSLASNVNTTLTAYDVLQQYNFPIGILPKGVVSYELNSSTGKFKTYLGGTCKFTVQSYELKYKSTIIGVITRNKIYSLKGIQVKVSSLWLNFVSVTRNEDEIHLSAGIASADFAVSDFAESPTCS